MPPPKVCGLLRYFFKTKYDERGVDPTEKRAAR